MLLLVTAMQTADRRYIPEDLLPGSFFINMLDEIYNNNNNNNTFPPEAETVAPPHVNTLPFWHIALFGVFACCVSALTVGGNLIVILSFVLERNIRQPSNYFIASLAVSDLLIGSVSMPFYTIYLLSGQYWPLGEHLCDLWLSVDYTACLCSIYTVFCITADRFCSVKLPAKYRRWRTKGRVLTIIGFTWVVPAAVFFTSIFGWQHFVKRRTVPAGKCYVQYMEDSLFNCLLQVGYFWITLTAMFVLYIGIYRVALDLHRRSAAQKAKTMSCLVSMAGRTVTQLGTVISITRRPCRSDCVERFSPIALNRRTETGEGSSDYDVSKSGCVLSGCASAEENAHLLPFWLKGTSLIHSSAQNSRGNAISCKATESEKNSHCTPVKVEKVCCDAGEFENNKEPFNRDDISALPTTAVHWSKQKVNTDPGFNKLDILDDAEKINVTCCENKNLSFENSVSGKNNSSAEDILVQFNSEEVRQQMCQASDSKAGDIRWSPTNIKAEYFVSSAAYAVIATPEELIDLRYADDDEPDSLSLQVQWNPALEVTSPSRSECTCECGDCQSTLDCSQSKFGSNQSKFGCRQSKFGCSQSKFGISQSKLGYIQSKSGISLEVHCAPEQSLNVESVLEIKPLFKIHTEDCKRDLWNDLKHPSTSHRSDKLIDVESNDESTEMCSSSRNDDSIVRTQSNDEENQLVTERYKSGNISNLLSLPHPRRSRKKHPQQSKNGEQERDPPSRSTLSSVKYVFQGGAGGCSNESRRTTETRQLLHNDNRTRKALRTITIILGAFVVCWIPWHVLSMIIGFCNDKPTTCGVEPVLYDISYWLCYLNSPLNPFCYAFVNQQFKKTFIRILKLDWRRK